MLLRSTCQPEKNTLDLTGISHEVSVWGAFALGKTLIAGVKNCQLSH